MISYGGVVLKLVMEAQRYTEQPQELNYYLGNSLILHLTSILKQFKAEK